MTKAVVVRYRTNTEGAEENERLIRQVFHELSAERPEGLRYAAFRLDDGVSFLHVATLDGDDNPLTSSAAFREFQSGLKERCVDPPAPTEATVIGSYRLLAE